VIRLALLTMLLPLVLTAAAKNVHGSSPAKAKSGYGTPSEGMPASFPKKNVKMSIMSSGCKTTHNTPRAACL
jgi:hypothetical protein